MSKGASIAVQLVLLVIIGLLTWFLVDTLEDGEYQEAERVAEQREDVRQRMSDVRQVLIRHNQVNNRFPSTLDSVKIFALSDSSMIADRDQIFGAGYSFDSLLVSPLSGQRFTYAASDTGRVKYYMLGSPDYPEDFIGANGPEVNRLNVATWE